MNAEEWLQAQTKPLVVEIVVDELITKLAPQIVDKDNGVVNFFRQGQNKELKLLYQLFSENRDTLHLIISKMRDYIEEAGTKIVTNEEYLKDPIVFTHKLLEFKFGVDDTVQTCFEGNLEF